jgi:hypothetical protein
VLTDIIFRLRSLLRRTRVETELDDELRFHFEQQVEKHIRSGLSHQEAVRRARLFFGGMDQVKEECRDARGVQLMEASFRIFVTVCACCARSPLSPWWRC